MQPSLQISLHLKDRLCLVLGGGLEAEERAVRLIEAQAQVIVVALQVTAPLARWASQGRVEHRARDAQPDDFSCYAAFICDEQVAAAGALAKEARAHRALLYVQDRPELSDFSMPALVRRGGLRVALSTSAASPALAARLRAELDRLFDPSFVAYVEWLDELRTTLRAQEPDPEKRAERLRAAVDEFRLDGILHYPPAYLEVTRKPHQ